MCGSEGVVDVGVAQLSQLRGKIGIACLFTGKKPYVLHEKNLAIIQRLGGSDGFRAHGLG